MRPQRHKPAAPDTPPHRTPEQLRGTSSERGYGYRWQKAREGFLRKHPLCVHCEQRGRVTAATDVDHITPHRGDKDLFWDRQNWQGLCHPCHSVKTATEDGGFGNFRAK
ncbi:HNH endonuclease [Pseudomonas sp. NPDC087358]|uniref:HNH endonuclease n=1 Tax=Pseudomonas sp. NPDC087358 TaxID=3364439 RepID=UPI00384FE1E5